MKYRPPMSWTHSVRIGLAAMSAVNNTFLAGLEKLCYSRKIEQTHVPDPVFILGHWRSGTTLLHNLMARDPQFATPNMYQVLFPHHFLLTEHVIGPLTSWLLPKTRPMDDVAVNWSAPQEDELAICILSLLSPYLMTCVHHRDDVFEDHLDLLSLSEKQRRYWKQTLLGFLKKVMIRNPGRQLLLKSPSHTFRIRTLLELFPRARFVHIVRNPYRVNLSGMHLRRCLYPENSFSQPDFSRVEQQVLNVYEHCFDCFERDRGLLQPNQLVELRLEDLEQDILGELGRVYSGLSLSGYDEVAESIRPQLSNLQKYRKNKFEIQPEHQRQIYNRCRDVFERYGYESDLEDETTPTADSSSMSSRRERMTVPAA